MFDKKIHTNSRLRKCFRFSVMLAALLSAATAAAQEPKLQWELANPFRFIRHQASFDALRDVYDGLDKKSAYTFERKLQSISEKGVEERRAAAKDCNDPKTRADKKRCFESYPGWFASLAEDNYSKTCWDSKKHRFRTDKDGCKDYIYPESHRVRVWVENPPPAGGLVNAWFLGARALSEDKSTDGRALSENEFRYCDARYKKALCIEFLAPYDVEAPRTLEVSAQLSDGRTVSTRFKVVDRLIVGLGDSYASGEGNPDRPARFTQGKTDPDVLPSILWGEDRFRITKAPRQDKDKGSEVAWLDKRCHRSMYSYQFQTALQLALDNPREAITFVSYSCSGAKTEELINESERSKEGLGHVNPQLESLRKVLKSKTHKQPREIDYLLLSIGGNDIGFAEFGAYVVLASDNDEGKVANAGGEIKEKLMGEGEKKGSYFKLQEALLNEPGANKGKGKDEIRLRIKGCEPGSKPGSQKCPHILLTPYPNILRDEHGEICRADRHEFDIPFGKRDRASRVEQVEAGVFKPLEALQAGGSVKDEFGWTVVEGLSALYLNHGFCARAPRIEGRTGEIFQMPLFDEKTRTWTSLYRQEGVTSNSSHPPADVRVPFSPREYRAYETRQRWIRLPVDAKLTTDQVRKPLGIIHVSIRLDWVFEDDRSNILHPTSEGLATFADVNLKALRDLMAKEGQGGTN